MSGPRPASSRRVLITGLSSWWGGRIAQRLELDPEIEALIGVDSEEPRHALERTEFVRMEGARGALRRILSAAGIDTVIDARALTDEMLGTVALGRRVNLEQTREVIDACAASPCVKKLVLRSAAVVYGSGAAVPAFLTERDVPDASELSGVARSVREREALADELVRARPDMTITILRIAEVLAGEPGSSHLSLLSLPVLPGLLGFDPRLQFVHEEDAVDAFGHATRELLPGTFNVAADGVLALSEVASLLGKPLLALLPPWGLGLLAARLRPLRLPVPLEHIGRLRHGRGLDNRRLKATGFTYRYTSRETVLKLRTQQRLRPLLGAGEDGYRYQAEVEEFLRRSPHVLAPRAVSAVDKSPEGPTEPPSAYEALGESEVIELVSSLEPEDAARLLRHEEAGRGRPALITALRSRVAGRGDESAPG